MLRFTIFVALFACSSSTTLTPGEDAREFDEHVLAECRAAIAAGAVSASGHAFEHPCDGVGSPTIKRLRDAIIRGDVVFNPDAARACLARGASLAYCPDAFTANVPAGGACDHDFECIDGLCAPEVFARSRPSYALGDCGTCIPFGNEGDACAFTGWDGQVCADGLRCDYGEDRCERLGERGDSCADAPCGEGLKCVEGTCRDAVPNGEPCDEDAECGGFNAQCIAVCDATGEPCEEGACPGACIATCMEAFRDHGRECDFDRHCLGRCDSGSCVTPGAGEACELGRCAPGARCMDLTCRAEVGLDQTCGETSPCEGGLICSEGRCRELRAPGDTCSDDARCVPMFDCRDGVCALAGELGEACDRNCRSGTCVDGICATPDAGTTCLDAALSCGELVCSDLSCTPVESAEELAGCPYDQYLDLSEGCRDICYLGT